MAYSKQTAVSDGSMDSLGITLEYIDRDEISVEFDGVPTSAWAWVGSTAKQIVFPTNVPAGTVVTVVRNTDMSALRHEYSRGAAFTTEAMDESLGQLLHNIQELAEGGVGGGGGSGSIDGPFLLLDRDVTTNFTVPGDKNALCIAPTIPAGVTVTVPPASTLVVLGEGGTDTPTTAANLGTGVGVYSGSVGSELQFKSIKGTGGVQVTADSAELSISYTGPTFNSSELGPVSGYVQLPSSIGSGSNSGIPNRTTAALKVQLGTAASPDSTNNARAISSQAVVNATYPWAQPSHYSPNEVSVYNLGYGRVNAFNTVLVTDKDTNMDNTASYTYSKTSYGGAVTGAGGIVGRWDIIDTRGSQKRGVGAEIVMLHDAVDRYDVSPNGTLSENVSDANVHGVMHVGMRISTLLSSAIITRGLDIVSGSDTAGYDTGVNIQSWRERGIYLHNNLGSAKGGTRAAIEYSSAVAVTQKVNSPGGYVYQWEQNFSGTKGWYYTLRQSPSQTFFSAYADGTVTLSTSNTGAKLQVNPDGSIVAGHTTPTNAGFVVPQGGCFWLNAERTSYIAQVGSSIVVVKNGVQVAAW